MPYKKRFQVTYKCVTLLSTSLLTSLWVLCTRAEQYNYLWWKFFPLPRSFRASKYHYRPDYRNLFTQEEYCNNPLKVICWFVLHIRKWYMPLRCIHSYSLHSYAYFTNVSIWECFCHIHVKYICVYIFCFIMKKQNQHANERSNIRSIYPLFPWKKYVYSMPFEKKRKNQKNQKNPNQNTPYQKHFQMLSLNIANVKWDYRNIYFWLNCQLVISINIYCPVERLCYALLEPFKLASDALPCKP